MYYVRASSPLVDVTGLPIRPVEAEGDEAHEEKLFRKVLPPQPRPDQKTRCGPVRVESTQN